MAQSDLITIRLIKTMNLNHPSRGLQRSRFNVPNGLLGVMCGSLTDIC